MADGKLTIVGSGRFESLLSEYAKLVTKVTSLESALKKVTSESKKGESSQEGMLDGLQGRITKSIAGYVGLRTIINEVIKAAQKQIELSQKAMALSMTVADASNVLNLQMGPESTTPQVKKMIAMARASGRETGIGEVGAQLAAAKIMGATSGPMTDARMSSVNEMVRQIAPLFRNPAMREEMGSFGASAFALKMGVPGMTEKQAVGALSATLAQSAIGSIENIHKVIPAALAWQQTRPGVNQMQNTAEGLAITAGISQRIHDTSGEKATYASAALAQVLKEEAPQLGHLTAMGAVREVQKDKALAARIQANMQGRLITKAAQENVFFSPTEITALSIEEMLPLMQPSQKKMDEYMGRSDSVTPELREATTLRKSLALQQGATISDARTAKIRALLYGGEIDGTNMPGAIAGMVRPGSMLSAYMLNASQRAFDVATSAGFDPADIARADLDSLRGLTARDVALRDDAYASLAEMDIARDETLKQQTQVQERGQAQAGAAAQRSAHTDN